MDFTFSFSNDFTNSDEKSDPLTSVGEFELISTQNVQENPENEWKEADNVESNTNEFIKHHTPKKDYSKLNISSSLDLFFTENFYSLARKYTNVNISRKNLTRKSIYKTYHYYRNQKIHCNFIVFRSKSDQKT